MNQLWLNQEDGTRTLIASAAYVTDGVSADVPLTTTLFLELCVPVMVAFLIDVTVQGGTQTSVDIDIEGKYGALYTRLVRYNSIPADGAVTQLLIPNVGAKPLPIGGNSGMIPIPPIIRVRRTFNTPGGTPTITFSVIGSGWALRNNSHGWPGMR
jgi:hypothetical protein